MTRCCPLQSPDDEAPRVSLTRVRTARRPHVCGECGETITPGQQYEICTQNDDGMWQTNKTCISCVEIRNHFQCGGWFWGQLWEDLERNFFPDMKAGGPCMEGLSPANKARLFERRMAWFATEEGQDEMREHAMRMKYRAENWWRRFIWAWNEIGRAVFGRDTVMGRAT